MLRLTGEYGDGWVPSWPMSPATYGERRQTIAQHAERAGRPAPECGLHIGTIVGESRSHVADLMEADPLGKLLGLMCSADLWAKHGLQHPAGDKCRGLVDLIFHELDPHELRELAPKIPFELVEEFMFIGNADEIAHRASGYAANGMEHVIVGNTTGIVGGVDEIAANATRLGNLFNALRDLS
jgi:phthiodiolone/phenolphthiodiolone dimycocerosates ketoreductase